MRTPRAYQISTGLGAGNIGDEWMARAFWAGLPPDVTLEVPLFPEHSRFRGTYPPPHIYTHVQWGGCENAHVEGIPGVLVGGTPVADNEELVFPLQFLAPRLRHFHERGLPVHAVGVGVDRLGTEAGRAIFQEAFFGIESWTVRAPHCREALIELGVDPARIEVAADLAWLYEPERDLTDWALEYWRNLGVDPSVPIVAVNPVHMVWRDGAPRNHLALALDRVARTRGVQTVFLYNECRDGDYFDLAASRAISSRMQTDSIIVPNEYFAPAEMLALLAPVNAAVAQRYHFALGAALAGAHPVFLARGQKMAGLAEDLGIEPAGSIEHVDVDRLVSAVQAAVDAPAPLSSRVESLRARARRAFRFVSQVFAP